MKRNICYSSGVIRGCSDIYKENATKSTKWYIHGGLVRDCFSLAMSREKWSLWEAYDNCEKKFGTLQDAIILLYNMIFFKENIGLLWSRSVWLADSANSNYYKHGYR